MLKVLQLEEATLGTLVCAVEGASDKLEGATLRIPVGDVEIVLDGLDKAALGTLVRTVEC